MTTKWRTIVWALLLVAVGAIAGHLVHSPRANCLVTAANVTPALDYLTGPESFSRIQNTKAELAGLSLQMRLEAQGCLIAALKLPPGTARDTELKAVLRDLEFGRSEFAGTDQEMDFLQEILILLKSTQQFERWTRMYLKAVYEHPTHPVVSQFASEALEMGRAAGIEGEVISGFNHLCAIPAGFSGKDRIASLLNARDPARSPGAQFTWSAEDKWQRVP